MQWNLPRPSRFADRIHRWALDKGFPWLTGVAPRWPRWLLLLNARWVIAVAMAIYPGPRRAIHRNLARLLGCAEGSRRVRRARRRMYRHLAFYWVDLFRFAQLPPEEGRRHVEMVEGLERVEEIAAAGRGAVLLTGHLGNWELGGVLLAQHDLPVSVVYVPDRFEQAEISRSRLRRASGIEEIPVRLDSSWASLPVLRALREGRMVAMQGDRDFEGRGISVSFFGRDVRFPRGPFIVALLTETPIVPTFLTYTADHGFRAEFFRPIEVVDTGDRDADLARAAGRWAEILEGILRRVPDQWYTFFDYWETYRAEPATPDAPAETAARGGAA